MKRLVLLWLASLVAVALITSALTFAQVAQFTPRVMSGDDLGFRVEELTGRAGTPTGVLVIRVDDEWVELKLAGGTRLLD